MLASHLSARRTAALITVLLALLGGAFAATASASTIAAGSDYSCAVRDDGRVLCWGHAGRLGNASGEGSPRAVEVASLDQVVDVATGPAHACAVRATGTVACWGDNSDGQLGDGTTTDSLTPVAANGIYGAVEVAVGDTHSCARLSNGLVSCWGEDTGGQSGGPDGLGPVGAVSLAAGTQGLCAAGADGSVDCWGDAPAIAASPAIGDAAAVAVGDRHACALRRGGTVVCWGDNSEGQLGIGTRAAPAGAADVTGLAGAVAIAAGGDETCAVRADGTVACWGAGAGGQLGDGSVEGNAVPTTVAGLTDATGVSVGAAHACAVKTDRSAVCWGDPSGGRLGSDLSTSSATPVPVHATAGASAVSDGMTGHSCALIFDVVKCWGVNDTGQLGDGTQTDRATPVEVAGLGPANDVAVGDEHTCAVKTDDTVRCWGEGYGGKLGNGSESDSAVPVTVSGLTAYAVAAGSRNSCAITDVGDVSCWGALWDQSAAGFVTHTTPVEIPDTEGAYEVTIGSSAICVLLIDGHVRCWGLSDRGDIGNGTTGYPNGSTDPVAVEYESGLALSDVEDLRTVDDYSTCARLGDGSIVCWGDEYGAYARAIPGSEFPVSANRCELGGGGVQCVGEGARGQLGDGYLPTGHFALQPVPVAVVGAAGLRLPGERRDVGEQLPHQGGGGGGGTTTPLPVVKPGPPRAASKPHKIRRAKPGRRGRIALHLSLPTAGTVHVVATASVRGKRITWFKTVKPLRLRAGSRKIAIVPTRAARRALARAGSVKVALRVRFTPNGGKAVVKKTTATVRNRSR